MIDPLEKHLVIEGIPKVAVSCFSKTTFDRMLAELGGGEQIYCAKYANLDVPIYKASYNGIELVLCNAYVGAPGCVSLLEDIYALGVEKVVLFGTCGVLDASIQDCSIIIPDSAIRDEGTSYHYAPPSDEIAVNVKYVDTFVELLEKHGCKYHIGKAWTTDGFFRETRDKVLRRKEQGCICVEMECSAVAALAQFRGKEVFHFFYAADNLDNEVWDERSLSNEANVVEKDRIAYLALELAKAIG
jgi:uridine phosphorylase